MNCDILHVKSTDITYAAGTSLTITIPTVTLVNGQVFTLDLCQSLPTINAGDNPPVFITNDTTSLNVSLQIGNYVRARSLKCRKRLTIVYGTDPAHYTVLAPCLKSC